MTKPLRFVSRRRRYRVLEMRRPCAAEISDSGSGTILAQSYTDPGTGMAKRTARRPLNQALRILATEATFEIATPALLTGKMSQKQLFAHRRSGQRIVKL